MDELVSHLVINTRPGQTVVLLVVRGGDTFDLPVILAARPEDDAASVAPVCGN
jgi:S1-C subfamily serine protease